MADLSPVSRGPAGQRRAEDSRDRGQLILVGAFALAVTLVALALVMNAAIYTENLATRSKATGTADAQTYQRATSVAASDSFTYAHEVNDGTRAELEENVTDAMETYNNITTRQLTATGQLANVTVESTTDGTNITDDTGDFQSPSDDDDWTVAGGVSNARDFHLEVDDWEGPNDQEFRVVADDVENWYLNISYDPTASEWEIGVNESETYTTCDTSSTDDITINFSAETVNGNSCPALTFNDLSGPYTLKFENGSVVEGQYTMVVDTIESYSSDPGDPTTEAVLYSMEVEMVYWTTDVRYETILRVAPGEGDG